MKKKVWVYTITLVLMLAGSITYIKAQSEAPGLDDGSSEGGAIITCNRYPGNKAKCWQRNMSGLGCNWTGNPKDWC